jgi:hypothetical protein
MEINKKYRITSDPLNIILSKYVPSMVKGDTTRPSGEYHWEEHGYYSSVPNALMAMVNLEMRMTGMENLQSVQDTLDRIEKSIIQTLLLISPDDIAPLGMGKSTSSIKRIAKMKAGERTEVSTQGSKEEK